MLMTSPDIISPDIRDALPLITEKSTGDELFAGVASLANRAILAISELGPDSTLKTDDFATTLHPDRISTRVTLSGTTKQPIRLLSRTRLEEPESEAAILQITTTDAVFERQVLYPFRNDASELGRIKLRGQETEIDVDLKQPLEKLPPELMTVTSRILGGISLAWNAYNDTMPHTAVLTPGSENFIG